MTTSLVLILSGRGLAVLYQLNLLRQSDSVQIASSLTMCDQDRQS